jgi:hypothetical protein
MFPYNPLKCEWEMLDINDVYTPMRGCVWARRALTSRTRRRVREGPLPTGREPLSELEDVLGKWL